LSKNERIIIGELEGTLEEKIGILKKEITVLDEEIIPKSDTYEFEFKVCEDFDLCMLVLNDLGFKLFDGNEEGLNYTKDDIKVQLCWDVSVHK